MALSPDLAQFCGRWQQKADSYGTEKTEDWFDRFFTLWVQFNALYTEVAVQTGRAGLADDSAAQDNLLHYLTATAFVKAIDEDQAVVAAQREIETLLEQHQYFLKLNRETGARQPQQDETLLAGLRSNAKNDRGKAILEALYCVRCNMFHGHKAFNPVQIDLLRPVIVILTKVVALTKSKLAA